MSKNNYNSTSRRLKRTKLDWFGIIMMFVLLLCSLFAFARVMATNMLATKYLVALMVVLLVVNVLHIFVQLPLRRNKLGKLICGIVAVFLSAAMLYGTVAVGAVQSALNRISGKLTEKEVTAVIVRASDSATELGDTAGYQYGILANADASNTKTLLDAIRDSLGTVKTTSYDTPAALVDGLYDDEVQAIILNEGYIPVLQEHEEYSDFSQQTRIIYEYTTEHTVEQIKPSGSITKSPFVVYCSGSDARYSDITEKSRSDVNIMAVVNPTSGQVLLISTPRDYYLPLDFNGQMDKLTHTGLYGVQETMAVLDNLYDTQTNYYARINFNGLMDIVDALGGVDVYSDMAFTTTTMDIPDGYGDYEQRSFSFNEGLNHLNGAEALAFSRERYAFSDGDNQRGRNQMLVIKAIVQKAASPAILSNYQNLLKAVSDNFITNMAYEDIASLVQMMQKKGISWNIQSMSAQQGYGDTMQPCYSASGEVLYVMPPDMDSINEIKTVIAQVLEGEVISLPDSSDASSGD